ncbi:MAG: response regulator [Bacteroidales bacterium]|jgi:two-component system chemotaxis response regulator CheY
MSKTIMTVDDSASMRQMVRLTLAGAGYEVVEAEHGQDALNKVGAAVPHMVVTDLNMPVMDGLTLIRNLRSLASFKGVPIVFLTTESDEAKKREAKEAGATGWLTKPFKQEQLLAVVKKVLG